MPKTSSHAPWWILGVAAVAVAGLVWLVTAGEPDVEQPVAEVVLPRTVSYPALVKANEDLERMVASLQVERAELLAALAVNPEELEALQVEAGRAAGLESELERAMAEAREKRAEAERYHAGLGRCVATLNAAQKERRIVVEGSGRSAPPGTASIFPRSSIEPKSPAPQPRPLRPVRTLSAPDVDVAGESIVVSARLWNPEPVERHIQVEIAVTVDGVTRDTELQSLTIPASGAHAVAATFHLRSYRGTIAGRVRVVE
jgi:hypothetical protein